MTLVHKTMPVSSVQLNKISSVNCTVHPRLKAKFFSIPAYPLFAHLHLAPPYLSLSGCKSSRVLPSPGHFWYYNYSNCSTFNTEAAFHCYKMNWNDRYAWEANSAWDPLPTVSPWCQSFHYPNPPSAQWEGILKSSLPTQPRGTGDFSTTDMSLSHAVPADWDSITNVCVTICVPWFHTLLLTPVSSLCLTEQYDSL